jgi:hypothetical protein
MNETAAKINFPLIKNKKSSALKLSGIGGGFPFLCRPCSLELEHDHKQLLGEICASPLSSA